MSDAGVPHEGQPPLDRPRIRLRSIALAAGLVLALVAVRLQAQLWETPFDIATLWWLLAIGVAFAILMDGFFGACSIAPPKSATDEAVPAGRASGRRLLPGILPTVALVAEAVSLGLFRIGWQYNLAWA